MDDAKPRRGQHQRFSRVYRAVIQMLKGAATAFRRYWSILRDSGRTRLSRFGYFIAGGAGASLSGFAILWVYLILLIPFTPGPKLIERAQRQIPSVVVSSEGDELARLESVNREWVTLDRVSKHVVDALIATEDHRFYRHDGVDNRRLISSAFRTAAGDAQGGSTLTMQLARNLFPGRIGNDRSLNRKLKEIVTAKKIERQYSKEEIIETYLNTVPFLYNARGIEMAAHTYFGKDAVDLTLAESATLIGMLKGTSFYNPIRHPERSRARRNVVLQQMVKNSVLTNEEYSRIADEPVNARLRRQHRVARKADHFVNQVEMRARRWAERNGYDLEADGLTIHTTLNSTLQSYAEMALHRQSAALQNVANVEWSSSSPEVYSRDIRDYAEKARRSQPFAFFWRDKTNLVNTFIRETNRFNQFRAEGLTDEDALIRFRANSAAMDSLRKTKTRLESGFIAIEPNTGHVLAWIGSRDYRKTPYDHVATSRRQPGSTFKPVVYAAALQRGYRPDDAFADEDVSIRIGRKDVWRLASDSDRDGETITLRNALAYSRNNITAAVMADVGIRRTARLGRAMGIDASPLVEVPSLALGTSPTTLGEMATMYNTIASDGIRHDALLITSISNADGETIASFESENDRVLTEQVARQLTDMLRTAIDEGTGRRIRYQFGIHADVAGKTGTTQNNMDGWFFLMHPDVVAGAWVGFDDPRVTFRSDFWGEGAHNALFIVGDFYREGIRRRAISSSSSFANPRYKDRWAGLTESNTDDSKTEFDPRSTDRDATENDRLAPSTRRSRQNTKIATGLQSSLRSIGLSIAETARRIGDEWTPEYEPRLFVSDPSVTDQTITNADSYRNGRRIDTNGRQSENGLNNSRGRRNASASRASADAESNDSSDRTQRRTRRSRDRDTSSRTMDGLREIFENDRMALLEQKREEYERLTRELERRLDRLRSEPETSDLERIIREAYLDERERNPLLRDLEERLGIQIDHE